MSSTTSAVIVLGSINVDLVIRGPRLPRPGETVLGGEFFQAAGGKGANQAVAAARLSATPVTFIGAVGDDAFGQSSLAGLRRERLDGDHVHALEGRATGVALILVDAQGENLISVASGANAALSPAHVDAVPQAVWASAGVFLTNLEIPWATALRGLERAREAGLTTILNPAPADRRLADRGVAKLIDVLTPNEGEAAMIVGSAAAATPEERAEQLAALGYLTSVMTLGRRGCLVHSARQTLHLAGHAVRAVDTTGAGDAFNGALAVGLAEGLPLEQAARWANQAAALATTKTGAQPALPTRTELEAALEPD